MRFALLFCCVLTGCGGLENEPLERGAIAGRLLNPDAEALVGVIGQPRLTTHPAADGSFRIDDAPTGELELFLVMNGTHAQRQTVTVTGGALLQLGELEGAPAAHLTVEYEGPEFLRLYEVRVFLKDTPAPAAQTQEGRQWVLPAGCYLAHGEARPAPHGAEDDPGPRPRDPGTPCQHGDDPAGNRLQGRGEPGPGERGHQARQVAVG